MERIPTLKCLPKKALLYLLCAMFVTCAFYTLYFNEERSKASVQRTEQISSSAENLEESNNVDPLLGVLVYSGDGGNKIFQKHDIGSFIRRPPKPTGDDSQLMDSPNKGLTTSIPAVPKKIESSVHIELNPSNLTKRFPRIQQTKFVHLPNTTTLTTSSPTSTTSRPDTCQSPEHSKLILLWTPFFGSWKYLSYFQGCDCSNCRVTNDRSLLPYSDAVVFHCRDMNVVDLPPVRLPHQRWVFYCLESPSYSDFPGFSHMRNMFNWTMTYRASSDIVSDYGNFVKIHPPRPLSSVLPPLVDKQLPVAWLSSHCPTVGGRDLFVQELSKYIRVDVFGKCGKPAPCHPQNTNACFRDFASKYYFFLAFENALCDDYITEKFFRTLQYDIIPVVFGGANYSRFAPRGSFVDALAFKSPRHLAFFLGALSVDTKHYSSYFKWRQHYGVGISSSKECELCKLLHRADLKPSTYEDLRKWWIHDAHCRTWKPKR